MSKEKELSYEDWVKEENISGLTNTQQRFAKLLLTDFQLQLLLQIGDIETVWKSIRKYAKKNS